MVVDGSPEHQPHAAFTDHEQVGEPIPIYVARRLHLVRPADRGGEARHGQHRAGHEAPRRSRVDIGDRGACDGHVTMAVPVQIAQGRHPASAARTAVHRPDQLACREVRTEEHERSVGRGGDDVVPAVRVEIRR